MATPMTPEELEASRAGASELDTYEYRNSDNEDDYFCAALYRSADGRHYRLVESSGMSSQFDGAADIGEWLTKEELDRWSEDW